MVIKIMYCKHCRKDGTYNCITIDTDRERFTNHSDVWCEYFVEAQKSEDINLIREQLINRGFVCGDSKGYLW